MAVSVPSGSGSISGSGPGQGVAEFLGSRPPFDAVGAEDLARVAAVTETEVSPRGKTILSQGAGPVEDLRMVRSGSVEVIHDGQVLGPHRVERRPGAEELGDVLHRVQAPAGSSPTAATLATGRARCSASTAAGRPRSLAR